MSDRLLGGNRCFVLDLFCIPYEIKHRTFQVYSAATLAWEWLIGGKRGLETLHAAQEKPCAQVLKPPTGPELSR